MPKNIRRRIGRLSRGLVIVAVPALACLAHAQDAAPPTVVDDPSGQVLRSVCLPDESARLRADTLRAAAGRAPDQAWEVASAFWCGTGRAAARFVARHTVARVRVEASGSGYLEPTVEWFARDRIEPRYGWAYDGEVRGEGRDIEFRYSPNGGCISTIVLRYTADGWLIVGADEACD